MNVDKLLARALNFEFLSKEEGIYLYQNAATADLTYVANILRKIQVPHGKVTWQIDRNVNTTNDCIANCKFCNFFRGPGHEESDITDIETYKQKIEETFRYDVDQLLVQGRHHPDLDLDIDHAVFKELMELHPSIKLHYLGPAENAHIVKLEGLSDIEVVVGLKAGGLASPRDVGAEILSDRVRRLSSKGKCAGQEWLYVIRAG